MKTVTAGDCFTGTGCCNVCWELQVQGEEEAALSSAAGKGRVMQVPAWESAGNQLLIMK